MLATSSRAHPNRSNTTELNMEGYRYFTYSVVLQHIPSQKASTYIALGDLTTTASRVLQQLSPEWTRRRCGVCGGRDQCAPPRCQAGAELGCVHTDEHSFAVTDEDAGYKSSASADFPYESIKRSLYDLDTDRRHSVSVFISMEHGSRAGRPDIVDRQARFRCATRYPRHRLRRCTAAVSGRGGPVDQRRRRAIPAVHLGRHSLSGERARCHVRARFDET